MELICPDCKATISPDNVNISSDLAKCDKCNSIHKASELADSKSIDKINNPPTGTKMTIKKGFDDSIELFYPKQGFKASMIFQIFFTIFWVGFVGFWTFMAAQGSILFAMFSIPFWIVGFGMLTGLINSISETQTLKLSRTSLTIKKDRPIRPKSYEINIKDIQSIRMKNLKMNNPFAMFGNMKLMFKMQKSFGMGGIEMPAIISGVKTEYFFEDANDAEQEWVTSTLDSIIKRMNN
jgi:DNA-directed RNA polymerase subunit M/transcription elongation factor TFIIS